VVDIPKTLIGRDECEVEVVSYAHDTKVGRHLIRVRENGKLRTYAFNDQDLWHTIYTGRLF
jgi:hypothetical protein